MSSIFQKSSTLRNLREQVVGVDRIKDDPIASDREDLAHYEKCVHVVKHTVVKFNKALRELNDVHREMAAELRKFYQHSEDIDARKNLESVLDTIRVVGDFHESGQDVVDNVSHKLDALLAMHAGLGAKLRERDKAHAMKEHYQEKMKVLSIKETTNVEKVRRNSLKQEEANKEYEEIENAVLRETRDALNTRFKDLDQILGLYLKFLIQYYAGIGGKFEAIDHLPTAMMTNQVKRRNSVPSAPPLQEDFHEEPLKSPESMLVEKLAAAPPPSVAQTSLTASSAAADSAALRSALGLRIQRQEMTTPASSDGDSDLRTPPSE